MNPRTTDLRGPEKRGQVIIRHSATARPPRGPEGQEERSSRFFKGGLVVALAAILAVGIVRATDIIPNAASLIAGVGGSGAVSQCPRDMVYVPSSGGGFCVDRYEASPGEACPNRTIENEFDTEENIRAGKCGPVSESGLDPWVNVPLHQASLLCARAGKRLPSNGEWYRAALGTPDDTDPGSPACAILRTGASRADKTGSGQDCVSSFGAYDMVGNVWEWVDVTTTDGRYKDRTLPLEGSILSADEDGVPVETGTEASRSFGNDHFFSDHSGVRGMMRGGFWGMNERAGIWTVSNTIAPNFVGVAVGFRCVKDAD